MHPAKEPKKRRGLLRRIWTVIWRGTVCVCAPFVIVYLYYGVRVWTGEIRVSRDYIREFNAPAEATPAEERGWPLLSAALASLSRPTYARPPQGGVSVPIDYFVTDPESPQWPIAAQYLRDNRHALDRLIMAAQKQRLAFRVGEDNVPKADADDDQTPATPMGTGARPILFLAPLEPIRELEKAHRLMMGDALLAADESDGDRVIQCIRAGLRISEWAAEYPRRINEIVGCGLLGATCITITSILERSPASLSDAQWTEVHRALAGFNGGNALRISAAVDFAAVDDFIQRVYTDDGNGGGLLHVPSQQALGSSARSTWIFQMPGYRPLELLAAPIAAAFFVDRSDASHWVSRLRAAFAEESKYPLWELPETSPYLAEFEGVRQRLVSGVRHGSIAVLVPALDRGQGHSESTMQVRDAARAAIALELFRRAHGMYPATLRDFVPAFLPEIPLDRHTGRPLNYAVHNSVPVLYGVGMDLDDDGGTPPAALKGPWTASSEVMKWEHPAQLELRKREWPERIPDGDWIHFPPSFAHKSEHRKSVETTN